MKPKETEVSPREFRLHFDHGDCKVELLSKIARIGNLEKIEVREVTAPHSSDSALIRQIQLRDDEISKLEERLRLAVQFIADVISPADLPPNVRQQRHDVLKAIGPLDAPQAVPEFPIKEATQLATEYTPGLKSQLEYIKLAHHWFNEGVEASKRGGTK